MCTQHSTGENAHQDQGIVVPLESSRDCVSSSKRCKPTEGFGSK